LSSRAKAYTGFFVVIEELNRAFGVYSGNNRVTLFSIQA
jgi:hypothetical protein